jgi:hypothetical protein
VCAKTAPRQAPREAVISTRIPFRAPRGTGCHDWKHTDNPHSGNLDCTRAPSSVRVLHCIKEPGLLGTARENWLDRSECGAHIMCHHVLFLPSYLVLFFFAFLDCCFLGTWALSATFGSKVGSPVKQPRDRSSDPMDGKPLSRSSSCGELSGPNRQLASFF